METQIPENLRYEMLGRAADLLSLYKESEYRRRVDWNAQALHIADARSYVNRCLNKEFMHRLRSEATRAPQRQVHPFKRLLKTIVEEAAAQIEFPRTAHENFPNNFAYAPLPR